MHWQSWIKIIGIVLLGWIVLTVDWEQAIRTLVKLDPLFMTGYGVCFVAMMLVRTLRLRLALARLNYRISFKDCYAAVLEPAFMGTVTPGRLGEFTRVGHIHALGVPLQESITVVIIERLIDTCVLLVFGVGGVIYIFGSPPYHMFSTLVVVLGLLLMLCAIRGFTPSFQFLQKKLEWILRWEPASWTIHRQTLSTSFQYVMKRTATTIFLLSLVCIALLFFQVFFLAKAFGFTADYLVVIFAYAVSTLIALLPISVGGLGTREATYIMIMGREGIQKEQALLFSLIDGVVMSIFGLFVLIIPLWICKSVKNGRR
jgi:uncharacterized protein (TIRG00374 family)